MNVDNYRTEAIHQLSDFHTYAILKGDPTKIFKTLLFKLVARGKRLGPFKQKEAEALVHKYPILSTLYHLPKTHKRLEPLYGRPIILGIGFLNERLVQWLDKQLQSLVVQLPGYLKDTNHLLHLIENLNWGDNFSWLTCDVSSLYSSIPHHLAIEAI